MILLAVGDVTTQGGLKLLEKTLPAQKRLKGVDFTIVNGENASGIGMTSDDANRIYSAGADVITLGNHAFARKELRERFEDDRYLLRPANMTYLVPGRGFGVYDGPRGIRVAVIALIGRTFMDANLDNPFFTADKLLKELKADICAIDFHAEATSEKNAIGYYLDGRVSAVFGTHTHVQTSDARVLPGGTGFITDLGMTGPVNSVLGMLPESSINKFVGGVDGRYIPAMGECELCAAIFDIDETSGRCRSSEAVRVR
jgi:metallophosphoesterase (TIGR00282 family)